MVFIAAMVALALIGFYFIQKANKPTVVAGPSGPSEPTANIWTVIGGLMDVFDKDDKPNGSAPVEEASSFDQTGGTFGPPQA